MKKTNRTEKGMEAALCILCIVFFVLFFALVLSAFYNTIKLGIIAFVLYTITCLGISYLYCALGGISKCKYRTKILLHTFLNAECIAIVPFIIFLIIKVIKGLFF